MPLTAGQVLKERYRIVKLLGQGGFGAVYRAWDTVLERPCALKENLDPSPVAGRQFQREAKLLARLKHPNLPDVKDYFVLPGQGQYLVMDFIEGDDLEELLGRAGGKLIEGQALGWIEQVCRALEYLHSQSPPVIHRDIKPANIKVTPQGQAVLVDFGIAKAADPSLGTLSGAHAATPGYAPYEQYGSEPTDARSDVYSLGATLYCLLTGVPPLESIARIRGKTLANPSTLNSEITPHTEQAILKALALHPEDRFQSVEEFRQSLTPSLSLPEGAGEVRVAPTVQLSQPEEVFARPATEPLPPPPAPAVTRPAWLLPAGIGLALIGCLVGGILLVSSLWPPPATPLPPTPVPDTASPTVRVVPTTALPSQWVDERGVSMALVPSGEFQMGSDADVSLTECQKFRSDCQREWFENEEPVHTVYLDSFYIDLYEVTNALYEKCVQAGACSQPGDTRYFLNSSYAEHPVVFVDWSQAREFCRWRGGDLPTEAQWEKAARGGLEGKLYPWGDEAPVCDTGASNGAKFDDDLGCNDTGTEAVGSFRPNGYGLFEMSGNVWEWVLDWYLDAFYRSSTLENPLGPSTGNYRALRGGAWNLDEYNLRVADRNWGIPYGAFNIYGFRCSRLP